jgi:hypothetical protein
VPVIMISGSSESPSGLPVEVATILEKPSAKHSFASLRPLLAQKALRGGLDRRCCASWNSGVDMTQRKRQRGTSGHGSRVPGRY